MLNHFWLFLILMFPFSIFAEMEKPSPGFAPIAPVISTESSLLMLGGLVVVLTIIVGLAWLLKRFALMPSTSAGGLKVVATTGVGQRERVVIVEINHTWLVLGVAPGHVSKLHTMDKPIVDASVQENNTQSTDAFSAQLNQNIKNNV